LSDTLTIPFNYEPRNYQLPIWKAMDRGCVRAILVWHRRSGKDKTLLNIVVREALKRVGLYLYFFPTFTQGKKIIWHGADREGFRFMDHFPREIVESVNGTECRVMLKNGSVVQLVGTENPDSIVGTNPIGCVFSEYGIQSPAGWDLVRPILSENGGWAIFNSTPRGKNHLFDLFKVAEKKMNSGDPRWFAQLLTVDDTKRPDGSPVITQAMIQEEVDSGMPPDLVKQEYYCSWEGGMQGSYYKDQLSILEEKGRMTDVPYDPSVPVETWWDIGVGDSTAIWFVQRKDLFLYVIDFFKDSGKGVEHYIKRLQNLEYIYSTHYGPHDLAKREFGSGKSIWEASRKLGILFRPVAKLPIEDGINAVRSILPRCWFDKVKTSEGLDALWQYHKKWDPKRGEYLNQPHRDWSSDPADAFRTGAVARQRSAKEATSSRRRQPASWRVL